MRSGDISTTTAVVWELVTLMAAATAVPLGFGEVAAGGRGKEQQSGAGDPDKDGLGRGGTARAAAAGVQLIDHQPLLAGLTAAAAAVNQDPGDKGQSARDTSYSDNYEDDFDSPAGMSASSAQLAPSPPPPAAAAQTTAGSQMPASSAVSSAGVKLPAVATQISQGEARGHIRGGSSESGGSSSKLEVIWQGTRSKLLDECAGGSGLPEIPETVEDNLLGGNTRGGLAVLADTELNSVATTLSRPAAGGLGRAGAAGAAGAVSAGRGGAVHSLSLHSDVSFLSEDDEPAAGSSSANVQMAESKGRMQEARPVAGLTAATTAPRSSFDSSSSTSRRGQAASPPGPGWVSSRAPTTAEGGASRPSTSRGSWNSSERVRAASPVAATGAPVAARAADVFYRHVSGTPARLGGSRYY
eukprot:gene2672-2974_t